jgi:hypothetical protein
MQVYARLGLAHILLDAGEVSEALDHLRQVGADGVRLGRPNIVRKAEQIAVDAERRLKSARSTS